MSAGREDEDPQIQRREVGSITAPALHDHATSWADNDSSLPPSELRCQLLEDRLQDASARLPETEPAAGRDRLVESNRIRQDEMLV